MTSPLAQDPGDNELFRLALEAAPIGVLLFDRAGHVVLINAHVEQLFGYSRDELLGRPLELLIPERFRASHRALQDDFFKDQQHRPMGSGREFFGRHKQGHDVPVEISLKPVRRSDGDFVLCSIADITERKRTIEQLRERTADLTASLRERDVLLQEVHHRVKNNLQVISSLINLQIRKGSDGAAREVLTECKRRVEAIGLIHEKLYQSHDYSRVPFSDYARSLARNIMHAVEASPAGAELSFDCDDIALPVDKAISCGLILNELLTDVMKHGRPQGPRGQLAVGLHRVGDGQVRLSVTSSGFDTHEPTGGTNPPLGLQLVKALTSQLDGELVSEAGNDTSVSVVFPVES
jgi:PAS domain S-box-containing protein